MREVIRGHQRSSAVIRGHQWSSEVIRGHQRPSVVISGHQWSTEVIRGHQRSSEVIQRSSVVISGHQRSSRGNLRPRGADPFQIRERHETGDAGRVRLERLHEGPRPAAQSPSVHVAVGRAAPQQRGTTGTPGCQERRDGRGCADLDDLIRGELGVAPAAGWRRQHEEREGA